MTESRTSPTALAEVVVLLDDGVLRIEHHVRAAGSDTVVVTFDPLMLSPPERPYGVDFLIKAGADVISVRKHAEHFYQPLSHQGFRNLLAPILERYRRRLAYGSSLGAYAVLYFCRDGFDHVVASSPRVSAHPRHGVPDWQSVAEFWHEAFDPEHPVQVPATIFYDPHDVQDRGYVVDELRPAWPQARFVAVPYAGHPANQFLAEIGFIPGFMRALVADAPLPALQRRSKRKSGIYHQVLAEACLRHRKPRWAEALARRSLELSPRLLLARRTLGEAALALRQMDEAEALLRDFAARYPRDGVAHAALLRLARARATVPAGPTPARAPAPTPPSDRAEGIPSPGQPAPPTPWWRAADGTPRRPMRALARLWRAVRRRALDRDDVDWAYRTFLGRGPESETVVKHHLVRPSLRSLLQSILDSDEYRHRTQAARTPAAASAATPHPGLWGRAGHAAPGVLVALDDTAPGVAAALRAGCLVRETAAVVTGALEGEALQRLLLPHAAGADLWITTAEQPAVESLFRARHREGARLLRVPQLRFDAFHPDVCGAVHRGTGRASRLRYHSAIAVWAYRQGLDVADTVRLFRHDTYAALGYLDAWPAAVQALQQCFERSDLRDGLQPWLAHVQRNGCFMHTPDHPRTDAIVSLAKLIAQKAGLAWQQDPVPGELADDLNGVIWPVYPEIAEALGLGASSMTWKLVAQDLYLQGAEAFVAHCFETYRGEGIAPADLEPRLEPRLARSNGLHATLSRLTGRTP